MKRCVLSTVAALFVLVALARADVAADLRAATDAIAGRDIEAASAGYRRAFEAEEATEDQRRQALDGLLTAAVEAGKPAALATYLGGRRGEAPEHLRRMLLAEQLRCQKAIDGHLHGAIARLEGQQGDDGDARRVLGDFQRLRSHFGQIAQQQARDAQRLAVKSAKAWRPPKPRRRERPSPIVVPSPTRTAYSPTRARLAVPRRTRGRRVGKPLRVPIPRLPRYYRTKARGIRKPTLVRPKLETLAAVFLSNSYRRSTRLAGQGFFESAKAELATVMQLFPKTAQADQAAQYAIRLFQRERGVAGHAQADALVAYLEWIRAVVGPDGLDYAEYLAIKRFAARSDATVVAREAEGFIQRHPDSKFLTGARLQLAIALDALGDPRRAIEVLRSIASPITSSYTIASPIASSYNVRAVKLLAWLYLFEGRPDEARQQFQALAAQTVSKQDAEDAKELLERMTRTPPEKVRLPVPDDAEEAEAALAERLYEAGDRVLAAGDPERAMDLFELFLRVGRRAPDYWAARQRIHRLRQKGEADEQ